MRFLVTILVLFINTILVFGQKDYFQQEVNVRMDVTLDDSNHTLSGSIEMEYINNSPDELDKIYMHLWANAYKNRNSAFAKQQLRQGSTRFYFAKDNELGNFKQLDFQVDGQSLTWDYDPQHPDIAILILDKTLKPGAKVIIKTPFTLKIPDSFSRLGHVGQSYQMTQWYPKPAVYDKDGWHPMPYLDMGEFYSEFGDYDVKITLPANYVVGSTGALQNESEKAFLQKKIDWTNQILGGVDSLPEVTVFPTSDEKTKTLHYIAEDVHDFAWFADKRFYVQKSAVTLASGKTIDTWTMFTNAEAELWKDAIGYVDRSVKFYSEKVGEYPYPHATAVQSALSAGGGMEYPMITVIGLMGEPQALDNVITHEVGHNWFYGILAFNERDHVWMDEGLNSYYDHRYTLDYYEDDGIEVAPEFMTKTTDLSQLEIAYLFQARKNMDQAPVTHSNDYAPINYWLGGYEKPAQFFRTTEMYLGTHTFDRIMQDFYKEWAFKHPQPQDLRNHFEAGTDKNLDWLFDGMIGSNGKIDYAMQSIKSNTDFEVTVKNKGDINAPFPVSGIKDGVIVATKWYDGFSGSKVLSFPKGDYDLLVIDEQRFTLDIDRRNNNIKTSGLFKKLEPIRLQFLTGFEHSKKTHLYWSPIVGWNNYDGIMPGAVLYNTTIPANKIEFVLAPMYGIKSKDLTGFAHLKYNIFPKNEALSKVSLGVDLKRFTNNEVDFEALDFNTGYTRVSPFLTFKFGGANASPLRHSLYARMIWLNEEIPSIDQGIHLGNDNESSRIYRLSYLFQNKKAPNPFNFVASLEQQSYTAITGNEQYLKGWMALNSAFSYKRGKAFYIRIFGGAFLQNTRRDAGAVSSRSARASFALTHQGFNDYSYDDLYFGRSEQTGFWSQQITSREGGFKNALSSAFSTAQSNNFIITANLKADLPMRLPLGIPLRPYLDLGYADNAMPTGMGATFSDQFYWSAGLGLEFFGSRLNVYFPILNSNNMDIPYASKKNYWGRVSFNIKFDQLSPWRIIDGLEF